MFLLSLQTNEVNDNTPLITQELVDRINNDPKSSFRAFLNPKWSRKTVGDAKKFLSPVRQAPINHGSARPVGYTERLFHNMDKRFLSGTCTENPTNADPTKIVWTTQGDHKLCPEFGTAATINVQGSGVDTGTVYFPVYDVSKLCSSWAPAVTSAMTSALWRWTPKASATVFNLSLLFILDCDILGDPCVERPPLSAYEQFWRRYIPPQGHWDSNEGDYIKSENTSGFLRPPSNSLTQEQCNKYNGCYPGVTPSTGTGGKSCARKMVLTGVCEPGSSDQSCPIYFLYNWRWMKSHIAEVGAITSSILVYQSLFAYNAADTTKNVYSSATATDPDPILGMLDVTIIGWGQTRVNLSSNADSTTTKKRWWYVIPHFGMEAKTAPPSPQYASLPCSEFTKSIPAETTGTPTDVVDGTWGSGMMFQFNDLVCKNGDTAASTKLTGVMKFNRRFDDCNIESQAVGAVPHNFIPHPYRSPRPTWSGVWEAVDQ